MDIVVPIKAEDWDGWLAEGDLAGEPWSGEEHALTVRSRPDIEPGERVYILAGGIIRGYAPLLRAEYAWKRGYWYTYLIRGDGARAMTPMCSRPDQCDCSLGWRAPHPRRFAAFGTFRYRSWTYGEEWKLIDWRDMPGRKKRVGHEVHTDHGGDAPRDDDDHAER